MTLSDYISLFPEMDATAFLIGSIIGALISAFFGFRLFKLSVVISFASFGFTLGYSVMGLAFADGIPGLGFDAGLVVGIALAIVFALISLKVYKGMIYLAGGMIGLSLGFAIPFAILTMVGQEMIGIVVGIVLAVVLAILCAKGFMKIMKPLIIIETSLGGMALAFEAAAMFFTTDVNTIILISFLGMLVGILAAKHQFRANEGRELFEKN